MCSSFLCDINQKNVVIYISGVQKIDNLITDEHGHLEIEIQSTRIKYRSTEHPYLYEIKNLNS